MRVFDRIISNIHEARTGQIKGVPLGFPKLDDVTFMAKKQYHLIGGSSGSGKSSLVDNIYIDNPVRWYQQHGAESGIELKVILRSMERSKELRISKWICAKLYRDFGIIMDVKTINALGFKKKEYPDWVFEKIVECKDYFYELEDIVTVIDGADNPTGVFNQLKSHAMMTGKYYYFNQDGQLYCTSKGRTERIPPEANPGATQHEPLYIPDNPNKITIFIIDHILAMRKESGYGDKQNIDKMSEYARIARDRFGFSPVMVSQLNRNITDTFRRVKTDLLPEDSDFAGSSMMYNDCDMAAILFNPYKYNIKQIYDYPTHKFVDEQGRNRFRTLHILKSTYGVDNLVLGYGFLGENGIFVELPKAAEMSEEAYRNTRIPKRKHYYG